MGRRAKDPRDEAAAGYPGRRKSKTERTLARMEEQAARDAELFAQSGSGADLLALPLFLADKRLAAAQAVWHEFAPQLDKLHLLSRLDRLTFAMFCIYCAEFVIAQREVLDNGYSVRVLTVVGAKVAKRSRDEGCYMLRENPALARRDHAHDQILRYATEFGFTPLARNKLISLHAMRNDEDTLFGRVRTVLPAQPAGTEPPADPAPSPAASESEDLIGALGRFDSPGPGTLN